MTDQPGRIVVAGLSKSFGTVRAVDNLSFTVEPGSVTGFLGPNGAGKTTTLRMVLGLVTPTSGRATIGGQAYNHIPARCTTVGAVLESSSFHPGRTARTTSASAAAVGVPDRPRRRGARPGRPAPTRPPQGARLLPRHAAAARAGVRRCSATPGAPAGRAGQRPRPGGHPLAARASCGRLADEGRTVLVSSHQLTEVQAIADRVVILDRGQLVRSGSIAELAAGTDRVFVRSPSRRCAARRAGQNGAGAAGRARRAAGARVVVRPGRATRRSRPASSCTS